MQRKEREKPRIEINQNEAYLHAWKHQVSLLPAERQESETMMSQTLKVLNLVVICLRIIILLQIIGNNYWELQSKLGNNKIEAVIACESTR